MYTRPANAEPQIQNMKRTPLEPLFSYKTGKPIPNFPQTVEEIPFIPGMISDIIFFLKS
jgi:hypothetical protein